MASLLRKRTLFILPAVLLTVALLEDIAMTVARRHVQEVHLRVLIILVLHGVAFAIAAHGVAPWLEKAILTTRRGTARHAGKVGLALFYLGAYGALYSAYFIAETRGVEALLRWR